MVCIVKLKCIANQKEITFCSQQSIAQIIDVYLERFTEIVASVAQKDFLKCGLVLHWFEMDNRGNRLINEVSVN